MKQMVVRARGERAIPHPRWRLGRRAREVEASVAELKLELDGAGDLTRTGGRRAEENKRVWKVCPILEKAKKDARIPGWIVG